VRHLVRLSIGITVAGGLLALTGWLAFDSPILILTGALLVIAGGVKIAMVTLWHTVANFGAPPVPDESGVPPAHAAPAASRKGS
jgi:hypothetical protein